MRGSEFVDRCDSVRQWLLRYSVGGIGDFILPVPDGMAFYFKSWCCQVLGYYKVFQDFLL